MPTENHLVFVPLPIMSHFVPVVQTAKLLLEHDQTLSITFLVLKTLDDTKIDQSIKNSTDSRLAFVKIYENPELIQELMKSPKTFLQKFTESQKERVKHKVAQLMKHITVLGLVVDMFCTCMIDVANELGIPTFLFPVASAAALGLTFHLQTLREDDIKTLTDNVDAVLNIQAFVHQVPVKVLPGTIHDLCDGLPSLVTRFRETKGILLNTFLELESHAIRSLTGDETIPPVYAMGPVIQPQSEESAEKEEKHDEIIEWLNGQPDSSVVFLCFGSLFCFEVDQLKEIALALEQSGQRFLWSLKKPQSKEKVELLGEYENLDEVLPEGFLERTAGIGMVIGWAPQMAILSHPATGGFLSHCGWSSTLESIWCGVPVATWPLAAEQQLNAFCLVKEFGVAVEVQMDYKMNSGVIVGAEKIESAIRQLMDPQNDIRDKMKVMKNKSRMALTEGGSSHDRVIQFIEDIKRKIRLYALRTKKGQGNVSKVSDHSVLEIRE